MCAAASDVAIRPSCEVRMLFRTNFKPRMENDITMQEVVRGKLSLLALAGNLGNVNKASPDFSKGVGASGPWI